jgi:hypothetical protein
MGWHAHATTAKEEDTMAGLPDMRNQVPEDSRQELDDRTAPQTYPTPFQLGGLLRSCILGGVAVAGFAVMADAAAAGEAVGGVLFGLAVSSLVLYRLVGSAFYLRYPVGGWGKVAMVTHDVVGTLALWLTLSFVLIITFVLTFFGIPFFWWLTALLGFGGKSTLNKNGVVYKRNLLTGNWEPQAGLLGPKTDRGLFGPNIEHGFFGDAKEEGGALGEHGEQLYKRRS